MGALSMKIGSPPRTERWWIRARGFSPCSATARSDATSIAAEASEICELTAAVIRPPSISGFNERIFSQLGSRGPSSRVASPNGTISASNRPSAWARSARSCDCTANCSMSSRVMPHLSAMSSAPRNCDTSCVP